MSEWLDIPPQVQPPFPVDDITLDLIEHSMQGAYRVDPDGTHHLVGSDMTLSGLLQFFSGYNPEFVEQYVDEDGFEVPDLTVYPYPVYSHESVIQALIDEIRRLRQSEKNLQ
jgi:hypothetical protein